MEDVNKLKSIINEAWENQELLNKPEVKDSVFAVIELIDKGIIRVSEPTTGGWQVNEWIKKAVVLYFPLNRMEISEAGPLEFHDKIPLKQITIN